MRRGRVRITRPLQRGSETEMDADEKLTPYGRRAVIASAVGYGLDGFDLLVVGFALSGIIATFHIDAARAGFLTTATLWGAVLGGILFGTLSDQWGRVRMLTLSVIWFAAFTGLSAGARSFDQLAIARFLAGIGIGGEFGIGMTLAAEAVPPRWRARATSWVGIGFQLGVLTASLVAPGIIGHWGWRGLFLVGTFPAVVALVLRALLPEPELFVRQKRAGSASGMASALGALVASPRIARHSLGMILLTSVQNFGYFGIMTWLPNYLARRFHMSLAGSSVWTAVTVLGMMLGIAVFGQLADRWGRIATFRCFEVGAALSVLVYGHITSSHWLLVGGFIMGLFANGMLGGYGALMAELYPTHARATAQNVLFNIGRGIGGFAPTVIGMLLSRHGFSYALGLLPLIYVVGFLATFMVSERRGEALA